MSNKITCTCGHSWNKSDSSKKDATVCHICGKNNVMQLGGFIYPVNYVPQKKNGGWLDAYDVPEAQNGIEGTMGGLTDKGFNYNGAWGGTMQEGGKLTAEQLESLNKAKMRSKMALASAFGNPSAKRMTSVSPSSYRFSGNEMIDGESAGVRPGETGTHFMSSMGEYAVPYIQEGPNGKLRFNSNASFRDREAIRFDNPKDAEYFAEHYKEVAPMMKQYAMGGSMPGSVGFTYARTGSPSKGPRRNQTDVTDASAQDGTSTKKPTVKLSPDELKMERLKEYAQQQSRKEQPVVQSRGSMPDALRKKLYEDAQSAELKNQLLKGADIATDVMQVGNFIPHPAAQAIGELGNMLGGWVDSYEAYDAYNKGNYGDVAMNAASVALPMVLGAKGYRRDMWNTEPGSVADRIASLGNREGRYIHLTPPNRLKNNPVIKKGVNFNRGLFGALGAETAYDSYQNGGEMKFYQEGLDWKPRNISRDGSEIPQAQLGTHMLTPDFNQVGENIMEMLSVPQKALTKLISGKYQTPSEAMGIKNKVGAIATDMILDPVNLIGAGAASKIAKGVKANKAANAVVKKVKPNFKSEINWAKWNKEIPENSQLMNEYNTIEQSTKKAGTWMKNPDGSTFKGTPEQFVQQNSKNFKKAFGNSKLVNPDGSPTIQYHGSAKNFDTFDESKFQLGDSGYSGRGIYTTPDKTKASSYALSSKSIHTGEHEPTVYELYGQGNNPISAEDLIKQNKDYDLFNFHRAKNWQGDVPLEQQMLDYDVAIRNQTRGIERISPWNEASELVFPTNKQLKSAVGNNGMFDMTNPNIFKSILPYAVPAAIGAGALQQKKQGGEITKDDNGYWNPENWGKPVEIGSNEITMQGVYEPLLGISDTGDTQMMYPGEDYKFKGKKVTEYPVAQEGIKTSAAPYFKSAKERDAYRQRLKEVSEQALGINSDEDLLIGTSYHNIDEGNNCINGVCGLNRKAGITYNKPTDVDRFLSGEKFAQAVAKGDEDYYQVDGNFQIGDHMMYRKKKGSASHNKIIYDSFVNDQGEKVYKVIDNAGGKQMKTDNYTESELKKMQLEGGGGYDKVNIYRPGYSIDKPFIEKERAERTSPEARKALADRAERTAWETSHNPGYKYSIRKDSEYYDDQPEGMQKFIEFANDDKKINALVEKLGVDKGIIHDELLNTFGELGQENKWEDRTFGGTGGIENTIEKIFKPKSWSIGPGQIKFDTIDPELKQKFNIEKPKDLYDFNKIIPLMTAINIKNRKWMENQGDDLSTKLIGKPGVGADELEGGVGRWTPYMYRGKLSNPVSIANEEIAGSDLYGQELTDKRNSIIRDKASLFDKGSYASNVFENVNKNLERTLPGEYFYLPQEMQPITVTAKKKKNGGWLDEL